MSVIQFEKKNPMPATTSDTGKMYFDKAPGSMRLGVGMSPKVANAPVLRVAGEKEIITREVIDAHVTVNRYVPPNLVENHGSGTTGGFYARTNNDYWPGSDHTFGLSGRGAMTMEPGGWFEHNNSSGGGHREALPQDAIDLLPLLHRTQPSNRRYGMAFLLNKITYTGPDQYPSMYKNGGSFKNMYTEAAWIRILSGEAIMHAKEVNGTLIAGERKVMTPAEGWFHYAHNFNTPHGYSYAALDAVRYHNQNGGNLIYLMAMPYIAPCGYLIKPHQHYTPIPSE